MMAQIGPVEVNVIPIMPRCRDCRWWVDEGMPIDGEDQPTWGVCKLFEHCGTNPQHGARAVSYEDFITAPDFGCVQFEAKDS